MSKRVAEFLAKYKADVVGGDIIARINGKHEVIGKIVNDDLVKFIEEDITPELSDAEPAPAPKTAARKPAKRGIAKDVAEDVVAVDIDEAPAADVTE